MASDVIQLEITGLDEIKRKLRQFGRKDSKTAAKRALRQAANLVARNAAERAKRIDDPATGDKIYKNIADGRKYPGVKFDSGASRRSGNLIYRVGVNKSDKAPGGKTFYWRFVEFGTQQHKAQPFMRPAAIESAQPAVNAFVLEYGKQVDKLIKKASG